MRTRICGQLVKNPAAAHPRPGRGASPTRPRRIPDPAADAPAEPPADPRAEMSDPHGTFEQTSNSDWTSERI
jgi:hypothetical protein